MVMLRKEEENDFLSALTDTGEKTSSISELMATTKQVPITPRTSDDEEREIVARSIIPANVEPTKKEIKEIKKNLKSRKEIRQEIELNPKEITSKFLLASEKQKDITLRS